MTAPAPDADANALQEHLLQAFPESDTLVRGITEQGRTVKVVIESTAQDPDKFVEEVRNAGIALTQGQYTLEYIESSLGAAFFRQTIIAIIFAFIAMSLVVLVTFRSLIPTSFVILAAAADVISTLAVISFFEMKLTTGGIAAFLMLIGYSVDTDVLLTTRVMKRREGTLFDRTVDAMRTGMLMSLTSFVATVTAYMLTQSDIIQQIMLILSIGLLFDIIYTWLLNAGILRWHLEGR